MKIDVNAIFFAVIGLSYFALFSIAGLGVLYIAVLGILFLAAAAGLFFKRKEGLILALLILPIGFVFGSVILYSSLMISGSSVVFVGLLAVYLVVSLFFAFKLVKDRETYREKTLNSYLH